MIELPKTPVTANPKKIGKIIFVSHQGVGKTTAVSKLKNCLTIDLENGSAQTGGLVLNLMEIANRNNISLLRAYIETIEEIKKANKEAGKPIYDYICTDGITALEKLARVKATADFKNSVVGKGMVNKGAIINDVVTDVPESGWQWLFRAFDELYTMQQGLAGKSLIYIAHSKQGSLIKDGVKLEASDMNLTGKLKLDLLRDVDACGLVYRKDPNTVIVTFKTNEKDLTTKARAEHLSEQELILSEKTKDGIITHWDKIFVE